MHEKIAEEQRAKSQILMSELSLKGMPTHVMTIPLISTLQPLRVSGSCATAGVTLRASGRKLRGGLRALVAPRGISAPSSRRDSVLTALQAVDLPILIL